MSFFEVKDLSAGYGAKTVLGAVSFSADSGRIVGVLGANGCGKTTLLKAVCGIIPHSGRCLLEGVALESLSPAQLAQRCGYIPQRSGISISMSALDVVLMGFNARLRLLQYPTAAMKAAALRALETVGLGREADTDYLHLSEGQKQLCILARTLVTDSRLLLLDEPESALDFCHRYRCLELLRAHVMRTGGVAVVALHDPVLALDCCDTLLLLSEGAVSGSIHPAVDAVGTMERQLSVLYGDVSLHACIDRTGGRHLLMLKEGTPCMP